ncbi:hypothetical protein DPMN_041777 [Dreissena polymorpha]|uniref:Uncharacterized protein n=1 Tax=Dreissena polymorpha TaxID=45954 RepID=A0A9D4CZF2_DREPO|nr:hypothetical protein DPMN_041777 [Dreissena polymorpha]
MLRTLYHSYRYIPTAYVMAAFSLPGTCLVTGGTNSDVTRLVGECVGCFNDSTRGKNDKCMAIGIVNLENNMKLKFRKDEDVLGIDDDGTLYLVDFSGKSKNVLPSEDSRDMCTDDSLTFTKDDIVMISSNPKTMQNLKGKTTEQTIGKIGTVLKVETNLDLQIYVCGTTGNYQPDDVTLLSPGSLNRQLKIWLDNHEHKKNTLVQVVLSGDETKMKDQLNETIRKQKPTRVGIDYNGDLYVKDGSGKSFKREQEYLEHYTCMYWEPVLRSQNLFAGLIVRNIGDNTG